MLANGKTVDKRATAACRHNHPSSALGFTSNDQVRNRSSMCKNCFREPSPLFWKAGNPKSTMTSGGVGKQKVYTVDKKAQKMGKSSIKSKKQSAAAIQNYFDNSKMLLNNSVTYASKGSSK